MTTKETIRDFLQQFHDVISRDEAASVLREARHYAPGSSEIPRSALGFILKIYYPLFLQFESEPEPEVPEPGFQGVV